jgi:hypothetical protein
VLSRTLARPTYSLQDPHIVTVSTSHPFNKVIPPHEYSGTPFEDSEVRTQQYFTLISDGDRGVATPSASWKNAYSQSPPSIGASSTNTPNASGDKIPKKKIPFSQYSKLKKNGDMKVSPKPTDGRSGHNRTTSAMSGGTPMSRLSSTESAVEIKEDGASGRVSLSLPEKPVLKMDK